MLGHCLWERVRYQHKLSAPSLWPAITHQPSKASDRAASQAREGRLVSVEIVAKHVTPELAYVVEIERGEAKIGGSEDITPWALRVTMIFRPEDGTWKVVHRHADPITTAQPAESVIQK
jgi:ketosteroid isomerase-like protein